MCKEFIDDEAQQHQLRGLQRIKKLNNHLASINKSDTTGCTCSGSLLSWRM